MGGLRTGTKSDLTPCLENLVPVEGDLTTPKVQVIIMDVAPNHYHAETRDCQDISKSRQWRLRVFCHIPASVCRQTRHCLGSLHSKHLEDGDSQQEREGSRVPGNWQEFLLIDENKKELFSLLTSSVAVLATNKHIITTHGTGILCSNRQDMSALLPCKHEEADTRIFLHLEDSLQQG